MNSFILQTKYAPLTADATPANPKKGAKGGQRDMDRYKREFEARVCKRPQLELDVTSSFIQPCLHRLSPSLFL